MAERHALVERLDRLAHVDLPGRDAEVRVGDDHAEQEQRVRVLDPRRELRRARHAEVGAHQRRLGVGEEAAAEDARHHRHAEAHGERGDFRLEPEAAHLHAHHHDRRRRLREGLEDLVDASRERLLVVVGRRRRVHRRARHVDHVARQLEIDGLRMREAVPQHAGDLRRRALRIVEARLVAGDLRVDTILRVQRLPLVMEQQAAARLAGARRAGDDHDRRFLGERRGHRIDHVERAGAVGDRRDAERGVHARGGVGGEADGWLVAQRVQRQDAGFLDDLEERQREIPGDAEDLLRAMRLQCVQQ